MPKLHEQIFIAALGSTILLGVAFFWVLRAERRKAILELRLRAIAARRSSPDRAVVSLRRPRPRRKTLPKVVVARLDAALAATGGRIGPAHLVAAASVAAVMVGCMAGMMGIPAGVSMALTGAGALCAPCLLVQFAQNRNQRQFLDSFPDALDLIVRAVRAGLPMLEAVEAAAGDVRGAVGTEFQRMLGEIRIGVELDDALQHAAERIRVPDFRFFVASLLTQRRIGGGIAETLANLSAIIRQRKAVRVKARALTAEVTASTGIVATMPFVAGLGLFVINHEAMSVLFVDPRGRFMLRIAVASLLLGIVVMKAMIGRSLR